MSAVPCRMGAGLGDMIGAPCPACGHTNLVHPGLANPSLDACAICTVLAVVSPEQLAEVLGRGDEWAASGWRRCAASGCARTDGLRMCGSLGERCPEHFIQP